VILKVDRIPDGEWYRITDGHRHESPRENDEKGVYDQNGGWDNIVWARVPAHGSIKLRSSINNPRDTHFRIMADSWAMERIRKTQPGDRD
jgi:hypothetical protein